MKLTVAVLAVLATLCLCAIAQDTLAPVSVQATQDAALVGVDVGAATTAMSASTWTGFHPALWVYKNWKGIAGTAGTALAAWGAYEYYDRNIRDDSSSSKSAAATDTTAEQSEPATPTFGGDAVILGINGDGNTVNVYNRPVAGAAAE